MHAGPGRPKAPKPDIYKEFACRAGSKAAVARCGASVRRAPAQQRPKVGNVQLMNQHERRQGTRLVHNGQSRSSHEPAGAAPRALMTGGGCWW